LGVPDILIEAQEGKIPVREKNELNIVNLITTVAEGGAHAAQINRH